MKKYSVTIMLDYYLYDDPGFTIEDAKEEMVASLGLALADDDRIREILAIEVDESVAFSGR